MGNDHVFQVPAEGVPVGVPPPAPEVETSSEGATTLEEDAANFYIGDEELKPGVISAALARLLEHPDEVVRVATRQAISSAIAAQEPAESDNEDSTLSSSDSWEIPSGELVLDKDSFSQSS